VGQPAGPDVAYPPRSPTTSTTCRAIATAVLSLRAMKFSIALILVLALVPTRVFASGGSRPDAAAIVAAALDKVNIFALPTFEMKANIGVENHGTMAEGRFALIWNGPDQWREEVVLPGYTEIQVGEKGVVFRKRTTEYIPLRIFQLHSTLGFGSGLWKVSFSRLGPGPTDTLKKVHERKVDGAEAQCVQIQSSTGHERDFCVDEATGIPIRTEPRDSRVAPIGTKMFPRSMKWVEEKKDLVDVEITELKTTLDVPASVFQPPKDAVPHAGCMNPAGGEKTHDVAPVYPLEDRLNRTEGAVSTYALLGTDGRPKEFLVVSGVSPGLNDASVTALRQWVYTPATCSGVPVEAETVLTINYSLR